MIDLAYFVLLNQARTIEHPTFPRSTSFKRAKQYYHTVSASNFVLQKYAALSLLYYQNIIFEFR